MREREKGGDKDRGVGALQPNNPQIQVRLEYL